MKVKRRIMMGTYALSAGYYDAYYGQAQKGVHVGHPRVRGRLQGLRRAVDADDSVCGFPLSGPRSTPRSRCTCANCAAFPPASRAIPLPAFPSLLSPEGLPIGVQVLAPALGEAVMMRVAA